MFVFMFILFFMDNDEKVIEGIEDIKEKFVIYSFEVDFFEMVEMIVEDEEKEKILF